LLTVWAITTPFLFPASAWMERIPLGKKLVQSVFTGMVVPESVDHLVPDGMELTDHRVLDGTDHIHLFAFEDGEAAGEVVDIEVLNRTDTSSVLTQA
jgi:hypothetical protein